MKLPPLPPLCYTYILIPREQITNITEYTNY